MHPAALPYQLAATSAHSAHASSTRLGCCCLQQPRRTHRPLVTSLHITAGCQSCLAQANGASTPHPNQIESNRIKAGHRASGVFVSDQRGAAAPRPGARGDASRERSLRPHRCGRSLLVMGIAAHSSQGEAAGSQERARARAAGRGARDRVGFWEGVGAHACSAPHAVYGGLVASLQRPLSACALGALVGPTNRMI